MGPIRSNARYVEPDTRHPTNQNNWPVSFMVRLRMRKSSANMIPVSGPRKTLKLPTTVRKLLALLSSDKGCMTKTKTMVRNPLRRIVNHRGSSAARSIPATPQLKATTMPKYDSMKAILANTAPARSPKLASFLRTASRKA
ncbi:NCS1 nucleoside transporter [Colletotrichum scovillei]|uniref:NCS1 nucleoside transporter n=1 Tax=Colletotrichum scovillei TaxID=1209932 RepID=A0A9P7UJR0_9PEZI|nr:NCS1 nucleoside transporter [Colletotrichum scovillei]KAG7071060.1 NCS1 nucleoside transporter [Colletotrichum scovillei]KAG7079304.1 NCS1 nucleoside transporter [Colletotrichum scovillei]